MNLLSRFVKKRKTEAKSCCSSRNENSKTVERIKNIRIATINQGFGEITVFGRKGVSKCNWGEVNAG